MYYILNVQLKKLLSYQLARNGSKTTPIQHFAVYKSRPGLGIHCSGFINTRIVVSRIASLLSVWPIVCGGTQTSDETEGTVSCRTARFVGLS